MHGRTRRRFGRLIIILVVMVVLLGLRAWRNKPHHGAPDVGGKPSASVPAASHGGVDARFRAPVGYDKALQEAQAIPVMQPHPAGYSRDRQFGGKWAHRDGMCGYATVRDYVLQRDMDDVRLNPRTCVVMSGLFHDPYTGRTISFQRGADTSERVQIDHVVAVHDAWASGLWRSDRAGERADYYNDPEVLQASDGDANQAKGDGVDWSAASDPVWLPQNTAWHCDYMAKRVYIKHKYHLSMGEAEHRQTVDALSRCVTSAKEQ